MTVRSDGLTQERRSKTLVETVREMRSALTAGQLAKLLGCSVKFIYAMVKQGRLPAIRIGSLIRFDPHLIADWIEARQHN